LRDETACAYIADEIAKWKRFDKATFTWDSSTGVATFSVEIPFARSSAAAIGEARNAIANMLSAVVKEPGDSAIKALKVEWLSAD
jgi:hypothetical protein